MIILGLLPKAAAIVAGIPHPVLGGAALAMFATVAVVGIQTLSRVDFHDHRNVVIVATSFGLAMYVTAQPDVAKAVPDWAQIIFGSGITLGSITAILLNLVFHHVGKSRGPAVAGAPGATWSGWTRSTRCRARSSSRTFSGLFQGPHWVVERAYDQRPFSDTHDLRRRVPGGAVLGDDRGAGAAHRLLPRPRRAVRRHRGGGRRSRWPTSRPSG